MALSPFYNWSEPDNSSLVKNGAADIRTLGDAIDTSVWNVGFGQAGKNKIINGDFSVNQRNFSSTTTSADYNFDRWRTIYTGGTSTTTAQVFTPGAAPVAGYEGKNYYRVAITGQSAVTDFVRVQQQIESVRTLAGQTATISFWAKASTGTPKIAVNMVQTFGTGGSPSAGVDVLSGTVTTSTAWARYSLTVAIPSISGKTFGTAPDDALSLRLMLSGGSSVTAAQSIGLQNVTFDIWGIQVEYGSVATPFQTASGGNPQAELAMCQRYYYRSNALTSGADFAQGLVTSVTNVNAMLQIPVPLRSVVTAIDYPAMSNFVISDGTSIANPTSITLAQSSSNAISLSVVYLAFTVGRIGKLFANGTTNAYIGVSAEL